MKKVLLVLMGLAISAPAMATKPKKMPPPPSQEQSQRQHQNVHNDNKNHNSNRAYGGHGGDADATAVAGSHSNAAAGASADNDVDVTDYVDVVTTLDSAQDVANSQTVNMDAAPVVTFVPNNNTENCLRVIGLSFANSSGGGGLGWPYRSKKCDYEQAADDAFAQGQFKIGWYWKCQNKNLYKRFGSPDACLEKMSSMYVVMPPRPQPAPVDIDINACNDHPETHDRIYKKCHEK